MEPIDRTNPDLWKWGFIYYNANDPKFLVSKRFGIGYTFNFAHKAVWFFFVAIFIIAFAVKWVFRK